MATTEDILALRRDIGLIANRTDILSDEQAERYIDAPDEEGYANRVRARAANAAHSVAASSGSDTLSATLREQADYFWELSILDEIEGNTERFAAQGAAPIFGNFTAADEAKLDAIPAIPDNQNAVVQYVLETPAVNGPAIWRIFVQESGLPDTAGHAAGEVLTVLMGGGVDWSTIGEAQIAAAVAQYLIDNPPAGVTQQQLTAEVTRLVGLINTNASAISSNDDDIQTNANAIAANLAAIAAERGRVTKNAADIATNRTAIAGNTAAIPRLQGQIVISPNNIPSAAAIQRDFKFGWFGLPDAWLKSQNANEFEVWANGFAFHAVDPWNPAADGVIDVNVNETEANGINIAAGQTIVSILMVVRSDGTFVAEWETVLEIIELPTTDAPTVAQFNAAIEAQNKARANLVTRSDAGDQIQPEPITNAAGFVSFLADQERSANAAIAHFQIAVAEDYKGVRHTYKVNDYAWFPPRSVDGKVFANIPPPPEIPEPFKLSTDLKVQLLTFHVEPGVIAYPSGGLQAALTTTVKVSVDNPDVLDDDIWVQGLIDGSAVLARVKWATNTSLLNLVIPQNVAGNIGQNEELDITLQFYDAANAGNLVRQRRIGLPLVEQRAVTKLANRAAYDALAAKDPNTTYYVAKA